MKCSKICSKHITDNTKVVCKLNTLFKKWEPIEIILDDDSMKVSEYEEIMNYMKNIVVSN